MTRTIVVTFPVPCQELEELELTSADHKVVVAGPEGFSQEAKLPAEADMSRLEVELFHGYLELRAPRVPT